MWLIMKKTYSGALGLFPKGMKYDLPEKTVEQLPKRSYAECPAPWEEHTDRSAIELAEAKKTAANNLVLVGMLESAIEKAKPRLEDLTTIACEKEAELAEANTAYNEAAVVTSEETATANEKARAFDLAHEVNIKTYELEQARGQHQVANSKFMLLQMDLDEAKRAVATEQPEPAADKPAEPEQITEPVPPPMEELGEAEFPKEANTDGPEKTEKQKPERKPPKKR